MHRPCKVLVVEDDRFVSQLLGDLLEAEGFEFRLADNGAEKMRAALACEPDIDIVVLDVALPGPANGLKLANEARARGYAVILVTGDHRRADELAKSGHPHLMKPFRMAALLQLIDRVLTETRNECRRPSPEVRVARV
ncbi:MAG: response regulator [Stellaceae bacterium]